jgi:RHS repeat-associated protein
VDRVEWSGPLPQDPPTDAWRELTYVYDASGRRIEKRYDGLTILKYIYDGDHCIAEYDVGGNLRRKYIYGPGVDEPVCMIEATVTPAATYYYHFDALGSVVALTSGNIGSMGNTVEVYDYSVYGQVGATDPSHTNRFLFTGREFDKETGLYYYRARYYKPEIGRFLQTDPTGYRDGLNMYRYCANRPTNAVDPSGLSIESMTAQGYTVAGYVIMPDGHWVVLYTTPEGSSWNIAGIAYALLGTHPDCVGALRSGDYLIYYAGCQAPYAGLPYPDQRGAREDLPKDAPAPVSLTRHVARQPHDPNAPGHHDGPHQHCYDARRNEHDMSMAGCPFHCGLEGPGFVAGCLERSNVAYTMCIMACNESEDDADPEPAERYRGTTELSYAACHAGNLLRRI